MSDLGPYEFREIAIRAAWGAAFTYSFNALVVQLGEGLAAKQARCHADQVADLARAAQEDIAP